MEIVGDNVFLAEFSSPIDRKRVLTDGPLHFCNSLMVFREPSDLQNPSDVNFEDFTVWVQIHNLPFIFMHPSVIAELGAKIRVVEEIDEGVDGSFMGKYLRIRITRSLTLPLQRCINTTLEEGGKPHLLLLRYERLPDFYYACGRVGHVMKDCLDTNVNPKDLQFGSWMRAGKPADTVRPRAPFGSNAGRGSVAQGRGKFNRGSTPNKTLGATHERGSSSSTPDLPRPSNEDSTPLKEVTTITPLKLISERELEEGLVLSIIAVKKTSLATEGNSEGADVDAEQDVDMEMEVSGFHGMDELILVGDGGAQGLPALEAEVTNTETKMAKVRWKRKARQGKKSNNEEDGTQFSQMLNMNKTVEVGGKRDLNMVEEGDHTDGDLAYEVKRFKTGSVNILNLATTAETAPNECFSLECSRFGEQ